MMTPLPPSYSPSYYQQQQQGSPQRFNPRAVNLSVPTITDLAVDNLVRDGRVLGGVSSAGAPNPSNLLIQTYLRKWSNSKGGYYFVGVEDGKTTWVVPPKGSRVVQMTKDGGGVMDVTAQVYHGDELMVVMEEPAPPPFPQPRPPSPPDDPPSWAIPSAASRALFGGSSGGVGGVGGGGGGGAPSRLPSSNVPMSGRWLQRYSRKDPRRAFYVNMDTGVSVGSEPGGDARVYVMGADGTVRDVNELWLPPPNRGGNGEGLSPPPSVPPSPPSMGFHNPLRRLQAPLGPATEITYSSSSGSGGRVEGGGGGESFSFSVNNPLRRAKSLRG
jgi:hypothetical protein